MQKTHRHNNMLHTTHLTVPYNINKQHSIPWSWYSFILEQIPNINHKWVYNIWWKLFYALGIGKTREEVAAVCHWTIAQMYPLWQHASLWVETLLVNSLDWVFTWTKLRCVHVNLCPSHNWRAYVTKCNVLFVLIFQW